MQGLGWAASNKVSNPKDKNKMNPTSHTAAVKALQPNTKERSTIIAAVDNQIAQAALIVPETLTSAEEGWLSRFRKRKQKAVAERKLFAGQAEIAMRRQLSLMDIAAEATIQMGATSWNSIRQLHDAHTLQQFASLFLEIESSYMDDLVARTVGIYNRAAIEAERIEDCSHPEFVKNEAREVNMDRFQKELKSAKEIGNRIGELLTTRLKEAGVR